MNSSEMKSPIKNLPVRVPGQSIAKRMDDLLEGKVIESFLVVAMLWAGAFSTWLSVLIPKSHAHWLYSIAAVVATVWLLVRIRKVKKELKALRAGRIGELVVGQFLEEQLRPHGFQVLHDLPAEGFNVDHVVIGPSGVFSIETKTYSKPAKGNPSIQYDGEQIMVDGKGPYRDPVVQAKAEASWVSELLVSSTGRKFPVKPVLLFPGWFVEKIPSDCVVWVLNDKAAITFIKNAREHLSLEDISLITFHLKRYVNSESNKPAV